MVRRWKLCVLLLVLLVVILMMVTMESSNSNINGTAKYRNTNEGLKHQAVIQEKPLRKLQEETSFKYESSVAHSKTEVRHIGFLKVHKAASSTMQNMFFRFGLKRNLSFVFTMHPNYFSRVAKSHLPLVVPRYRRGYDILCNHGVFNYNIYSSILPKDTTYLAIVREPLDLFISSVNYYSQPSQAIGYVVRTPKTRIQNLIQNPEKYDKGFFTYTKNTMARDFGFEPSFDTNYTHHKLNELGRVFKLVLLVEYFEESLILMKRYLNWKLQDILFIPNNVYSKTGESINDLTPADVQKFRNRNALDYEVYEHFYQKFWNQFNTESLDIHQEVWNFKKVLNLILTFCSGTKAEEQDSLVLTIDKTEWNEEFQISTTDCGLMKKDELVFISELRRIQGSELRKPRPKVVKRRVVRRNRL